ncbi:DUF2917 domain-containing protein [Ramlibacter terrae]|uniref:DUF2917 domain-containing protein n=1 Tax=Ramlibacter terrae TaxID=2732511 RepID=A0ABX6P8E5_9BURK|nr:DUF2917 domain-containing protein [Ramlibacter terrae]
MTAQPTAAQLLQASPATALPGTRKLARGRAITLRPGTNGILRVAHGRVWATLEGPHGVTPTDSGDHVLEVGRSMWIRAGQAVVVEAWNPRGASYFSWDPVLAPAPAPVRPQLNLAGVLQPLSDLRLATGRPAARCCGCWWGWEGWQWRWCAASCTPCRRTRKACTPACAPWQHGRT